MGDKSGIQWTDATWNPVTGCSRVSEGCRYCYAERLAGGRLAHTPRYKGLTVWKSDGPHWTGKLNLHEDQLGLPLRWTKPRKIFVNSMSDLFHEDVPFEFIDKVFAVMALSPRHTFQVLTKRPERMRGYFDDFESRHACDGNMSIRPRSALVAAAVEMGALDGIHTGLTASWPLPNVWLGVSAEDQKNFDARWAAFKGTPAAVTMVSLEPLLGPIVLPADFLALGPRVWVIVGGETGPRPMDADWARAIRNQCRAAGARFYMKQMARRAPIPEDLLIREWPEEKP